MKRIIKNSILEGLHFLRKECKGGRFSSYWGIGSQMFLPVNKNWNDNYISILAANCLLDCKEEFEGQCFDTLTKIFSFLLGKFERAPVMGFFHSPVGREKWPPDGDDTGLAASVLIRAGVDRKLFQETVKIFWNNYDGKRGDFRMYFGETPQFRKKERSDPMSTVSMIIFLFLMGEDLKKMERPIDKIFRLFKEKSYLRENFSFYYHNPIIFLYYLGMMIEILQLPVNKKLFIKRVVEVVEIDWDNSLNLAIGITSIVRFKKEVNEGLLYLLLSKQSNSDGGWPLSSVFRLGRTETQKGASRTFRYSGSRAVTTALAVQALCRCYDL